MSSRVRIIVGAVLGVVGIVMIAAFVGGGRIAKARLEEKLSTRLGRRVTVERVVVRWGRAAIRGLTVEGGGDGLPALVRVPRISARFKMAPLLAGRLEVSEVVVERPQISVLHAPGDDNLSGVLEAARKRRDGEAASGGGSRRVRVGKVRIVGGEVVAWDAALGEARVGSIDGEVQLDGPGEIRLTKLSLVPHAGRAAGAAEAEKVVVKLAMREGKLDGVPTVEITAGSATPARGMVLSGIFGTIGPDAAGTDRARVDVRGSYGGATTELWNMTGWIDPRARKGDVKVRAARFRLSQLESVLDRADAVVRVMNAREAEVDGKLDLQVDGDVVRFSGSGHLAGLTLAHPGLAPVPVSRLGFDATLDGTFDIPKRRLEVTDLQLHRANVHATATLLIDKKERVYGATLKVKPVPCQAVLAAIPPELVPHLQGFKLQGTFSTDLAVKVQWVTPEVAAAREKDKDSRSEARGSRGRSVRIEGKEILDAAAQAAQRQAQRLAQAAVSIGAELVPMVDLGGRVGIEGCKAVEAPPAVDATRFLGTFEQTVQLEPGKWRTFLAGPENPDWVPYGEISPHVINSIMTTEDNNFFKHRGFIAAEFRSALQQNLLRGYFRLGASSITMQMVKNVLLSREKTLSRKLQELFLTWYVEKHLGKERILEIYFNVIEFGPAVYGIGPAAKHYFGKTAKELQPAEAAYFSSILPSPKRRYVQYCHANGVVDAKWDAYLKRILKKNHERQRLTDAEFADAVAKPLKFDRAQAMPERECVAYVKRVTTPPGQSPEKSARK
jgi:hypothetical protein